MAAQFDLVAEAAEGSVTLLAELLHTADSVLVKKLSNNDRDWAQLPNKHQHGVYIPPEQRDSGFFPPLVAKERDPDADEIRETYFHTDWPQVAEAKNDTRLVNYTSKGAETHMTRVPKAAFSTLSPASHLVMGRYSAGDGATYRCLTIDSNSDDALVLADVFGLDADFVIGIFEPQAFLTAERDRIVDFAELVIAAWLAGDIAQFAVENATMPATLELAGMARAQYLAQHRLPDLNPFKLDRPGDAVREISRRIEWDLFREYQRRERATALVRTVLGDRPREISAGDFIRGLVDNIGEIDRLMLSASQQRKSRAGYSFEHHIEAVLTAGNLPFAKQVVMDAKKRPDFVLPSLRQLKRPKLGSTRGIILSAKTTLRERWKQVQREMAGSELFLATVDESIAANAIEDMAALGIILVVPEGLKASSDTEYVRHPNVIGFKDFFEIEITRNRLPGWQ
ncbi:type II restriction endonuclease [Sphingomonas colocasiae]|uniref:Restriction endonuclease type II EcoRII C-terminal domain-containing protein n=1 Tax=Sphingomonas colocasiae TaxID=1848973 RepID=A0ABS7PTJ1_9SPHN|nr:hypothetical protein [Sphingomonas colocasiae]